MTIRLYDTMTRAKQELKPADPKHVKMYVCGPTVYDRPHIGNARSVVVYDVLYRLLRATYGEDGVTYVRNITDVDDKINAAATERGISIQQLTEEATRGYHEDITALNVLPVTLPHASAAHPHDAHGHHIETKATEHISLMIAMIERLLENGNAYVADGHVLFDVTSKPANSGWHYGMLSARKLDDLIAGARIEVQGYKKHPGDFVLWKPAGEKDDPSSVFDCGSLKAKGVKNGRPGWHIECSAMSTHYLGHDFDIHGGGADLMFPHHENEIAQSVCAHPGSAYAKLWVHNGFLTVDGEKMSKSLGNFITVRELLDKGVKGEVIRYALLSTHYRAPLDWTEKLLSDAKDELDKFYRVLGEFKWEEKPTHCEHTLEDFAKNQIRQNIEGYEQIYLLSDDLNFAKVREALNTWANSINVFEKRDGNVPQANRNRYYLKKLGSLLGILQADPRVWFQGAGDDAAIHALIDQRAAAKKAKNWAEADRIRNELTAQGILLEDKPDGTTGWRRG